MVWAASTSVPTGVSGLNGLLQGALAQQAHVVTGPPKCQPSNYSNTPYRKACPCNRATDACAQTFTNRLTAHYQNGMAGHKQAVNPSAPGVGVTPSPTQPCYLTQGCDGFEKTWLQLMGTTQAQGLRTRVIYYDPSARPWVK